MASNQGHRLRLDSVSHRFGDVVAVHDISLDVTGGELVALLGPSGCGKSTLLRIVSGFIRQSQGRVLFDEDPVDHLPPSRRGVGIVFQNYALFPHMTVAQNVAYGLEAHKWPRARIGARVAEMLDLVHMSELAQRRPRELSGGQQQRVALARCLAIGPKVLLLDEPFAALDKNLRLDMQIEVKRLQRGRGITTVLVTHDQEEALSMADRIGVMAAGRIEQVSSPTEIYDSPRTLFVNRFVGAANVLPAEVVHEGGGAVRISGSTVLPVPQAASLAAGSKVLLCMRPEQLRLDAQPGPARIPALIKTVMPLGPNVIYELELASGLSLKISEPRERGQAIRGAGESVHVTVLATACRLFPLQ
ncbi:MAG: ABC transporter ATP-binding protein [Xanthobacteraceae bacterium]